MKRCILFILLLPIVLQLSAQEVTTQVLGPTKGASPGSSAIKVTFKATDKKNITNTFTVGKWPKEFQLIHGPVSSKKRKSAKEYEHTLAFAFKVTKPGQYALPVGTINMNGKIYKTTLQSVETRSARRESDYDSYEYAEEEEEPAEVDAFVRTILSKDKVAMGDTLKVTYRFYTITKIKDVGGVYLPIEVESFIGLEIPLDNERKWELEKYNGKNYQVIDFAQKVLMPKSIGKKEVDDGFIDFTFRVPTGRKLRGKSGLEDEIRDEERRIRINGYTVNVVK